MFNNNNLIPIKQLKPFTKFCCTIGELPSSYLISLTYEEQLLWLCDYLQNTVIPAVNNNAEAVAELQSLFNQLKDYVNNYFTNLNVQNEINKKLDEMASDGTLDTIINQNIFNDLQTSVDTNTEDISTLKTNVQNNTNNISQLSNELLEHSFIFENVSILKSNENLKENTFAKTLGFNSQGDNGDSYYKIRKKLSTDIIDEKMILSLTNFEDLIAEFININPFINPCQFGAVGNGVIDDTTSIQYTFNYASTNNLEVLFSTPEKFYLISNGLICPSGVAGIFCEKYDYEGIIRPSGENYTVLTIAPTVGFYCKNLTIGSSESVNVNGILFKGHVGLNLFEHCRVYNLNGFGIKFNAIWDSLLSDISVEKCGNSTNFAFQFDADGDTCNMTTVNRLQLENCNTNIISISPLTISCNFYNLHLERENLVNNNNSFILGGTNCIYENVRIHALNQTSLNSQILLQGSNTTYTVFRIESELEALAQGENGAPITIENSYFTVISEFLNQNGLINIYNSTINLLNARSYLRVHNCNIPYLNMLSSVGNGVHSKFYDCNITTCNKTDISAIIYAKNCSFNKLPTNTIGGLNLYDCSINQTDNSIAYTTAIFHNCIFKNSITIDFAFITMLNCEIEGDLNYQAGSYTFSFRNMKISGNVSSLYSSTPTTDATVGLKTDNLNPAPNTPSGWIYTSAGWRGFGQIES